MIAMKYPVLLIALTLCLLVPLSGAAEIPDSAANAIHVDAPPTLGIDLRPYTFSPPTGGVPRTFTITSSVKNFGGTNAGGFGTEYYLSTDTTITTADHKIGTSLVAGCAAGGTVSTTKTVTVSDTVGGGFYYVGMIVDAGNDVAEMNENNNIACSADRVTLPTPDLPDLQAFTFEPPSGSVARSFTILNEIGNFGDARCDPFTVGFYLSGDATVTTNDVRIGTRFHSGLPLMSVGANEETSVTIPDWVPGGAYYIGMIIDPDNAIAETHEDNNVSVSASTVRTPWPSGPDLGTWTFFVPPFGSGARTFTIRNAVKNYGLVSSGPFRSEFYLSSDSWITTEDTLIGMQAQGGIAATTPGPEFTSTVTIPDSIPGGTYYVGWIIDSQNAVAETNETNNVYCDMNTITIPAPPLPDLTVNTYSPPTGPVARTFTIRNGVKNIGSVASGSCTIEFLLSSDIFFSADDISIGTRFQGGLAAGAVGADVDTTVTVPASVPAGTYYVYMIIDSEHTVDEMIEFINNDYYFSTPLTIAAARLPDLAASVFTPPSGLQPRTFTITNAIRNYCDDPADTFSVGFYLSSDQAITTADALIGTRTVVGGLAGQSATTTEATSVTVPASVPAGTYYVGMIIDPSNAIPELAEDNNVERGQNTVTIPAVSPTNTQALTLLVPGGAGIPRDLNGDGKYEDVNGNGRKDFADITLYFNQMTWIGANEPLAAFDYNGNGRIDFADVTWLFNNL
jgi:subtilase family serine protease